MMMNRKLNGAIIPRSTVTEYQKNAFFDLWESYYQNVDRGMFEDDLAEKDWILTLSDESGIIRGFTTMKFYELEIRGKPIRAIFNGSTIIDRDYWGEQELVHTWCRFMAELKRDEPEIALYWYLIVSGFRTYMFLPLYFREFYPNHATATPAFEQEIIDTLAEMKFPEEYRQGIVRVANPRECLDPDLAVPNTHKLRNPHIRFFVERNKEYLRGDEMVCLTEFTIENTKRTANLIAEEILGSLQSEKTMTKEVVAS
ncbi:MAG: hypothetical protein CMN02_14465 [Roseibacillus sp.]|nr:hypothetical protein [Roseibacillus sp.]